MLCDLRGKYAYARALAGDSSPPSPDSVYNASAAAQRIRRSITLVDAALTTPDIQPADRLSFTLFFAAAAHAAFILGVGIIPDDDTQTRSSTLEIVLVQHGHKEAPEDADYLAPANQDGGGESKKRTRPTTPLVAPLAGLRPTLIASAPPARLPDPAPRTHPPRESRPAAPRPRSRPVLALSRSSNLPEMTREPEARPKEKTIPAVRKPPKPETKAPPAPVVNQLLVRSPNEQIASLSAEFDRKLKAYAKRPKRKWITAKTREYKYASYMEAWRSKVERVGNLNYPDEARRRKLSGDLLLDVAVKPDGSVGQISLRRSSGHRVLDDAAVRIVMLAAPFDPFPENIREDIDILHIGRTWQFLGSNRLASK